MERKSTTFCIHIDEYGRWSLYCNGQCALNPKEFILRLSSDVNNYPTADVTWVQALYGYPTYIEGEWVEVILHRIDEQNNTEITERLC